MLARTVVPTFKAPVATTNRLPPPVVEIWDEVMVISSPAFAEPRKGAMMVDLAWLTAAWALLHRPLA